MKTPGKLLITRGLPASGKTTWSRHVLDSRAAGTVVRLNRDDLRASMLPSTYRTPEWRCEELVSLVQRGPIPALLQAGVDVIVDDTNLRAKHARFLAQLAASAGAEWECVDDFLAVPLEVCLERDRRRDRPVGDVVILEMHRKFLANGRTPPVPVLGEGVTGRVYVPTPGTRTAVMVDIDGTVALHEGVRGPYDTSLYHLDRPNAAVIEAVRQESLCGNEILFCSGRDETFFDATVAWLRRYVITPNMEWSLFMRKAGDIRNDAVVKLELFDRYIRDDYYVLRVYDDRDRVVAAWRSLGLTVLQVAPGAF